MVNYNVGNSTQWESAATSIASTPMTSSDTITITADFGFSANPTVIDIQDGTVSGDNYTITMSGTVSNGFFTMYGGTITNLNIDGGGLTYDAWEGCIVKYDNSDQ